ncbi:MAG: FkbM family methyltransferase [Candidatus Pacebacteria bacterium]|nr:FkbM family methyltransferase [Candidatus Paceibacterota bacterium]
MGIKAVEDIILQKKFLKYSVWERFAKRSMFKLKRIIWKPRINIVPFVFKKWGDIQVKLSSPPEKTGWEFRWYGYWEMEKTLSKEFREFCQRIHRCSNGLTEEELEKQCFLSIINEIKDNQIKMFELGAGAGRESLALAGVVDFNLVSGVGGKTYRCLAVEAEPTHYRWIVEHFEKQNIKGEVVHGAVSDKSGYVSFDVSLDPATFYGQAVVDNGGYQVRSFTVDELIEKYNFPKVNIVHLDVQGSELKVMLGAENSIKKSLIDYWIIGTHERYLEEEIIKFCKEFYDIILYIPQKSGLIKHSFYGMVFIPQDGLLILRNKKLSK